MSFAMKQGGTPPDGKGLMLSSSRRTMAQFPPSVPIPLFPASDNDEEKKTKDKKRWIFLLVLFFFLLLLFIQRYGLLE